jgi:hypothetical protein
MTNLNVKFTKDQFWKRFVRFDFEFDEMTHRARNDGAAEKETESKAGNDYGFSRRQSTFVSVYDTFFIHFPFQAVMSQIQVTQMVDQKLRDFCSVNGTLALQSQNEEVYQLSEAQAAKCLEIIWEIISITQAIAISLNSSIVQLSSQFDILVASIVAEVISRKPDILNSSERKIEYGDLYAFDSLDAIKQHFSEKFIESIIRKNRTEQFTWFSQTLKIPMTKDLDSWPKFIEINERRNLLTHTDGVVSSAYLKNCQDAGYSAEGLKVGDQLKTDFDYFKQATGFFLRSE